MAQQRFFNFGTTATPDGLKAMMGALFDAQLLYGAELSASGSTVQIAPHAALLTSRVLLVETEAKDLTLPLTSAAKTYTIRYRHTDANVSGGTAALLDYEEGFLAASTDDKTVLGWVYYPGGSVLLASSMLRRAAAGRQPAAGLTQTQTSRDWLRILSSAIVPMTGPDPWTVAVPGAAPYSVVLLPSDMLLTSAPSTGLVLRTAAGVSLVQVATIGAIDATAANFHLDYSTRTLTFSASLSGATVTGVDLTHGALGWDFRNTTGTTAVDEFAVSFPVVDRPPARFEIDLVRSFGSVFGTVTPLFVLDTNSASLAIARTAVVDSGARRTVTAELQGGAFVPGGVWTAYFRVSVPNGHGYYLRTVKAITE